MNIRHPSHFPHFFHKRLPKPLEELYLSAGIMDFATAAITLFEPIYLWTIGYDVRGIMLFYLIVYVAYYPLLPLGGKYLARYGPEHSIRLSTVFLVAYLALLIGIAQYHWLFYLAPILYALQKTFYWPAYHFDFIRFSARKERASEFSAIWAITTLMYVIGPITGGFIAKFAGFNVLFAMAAGIILVSSVPLFVAPPHPKRESFDYFSSLILPFRQRYLRTTIAYLSLGSELILLTLWPVFILFVFKDLFNVGLLVGLSALVTTVATLAIGKVTDRSAKRHVVATAGLVSAGLWIARLLTRLPPFVFLLDLGSRVSYNATFVGTTTLTYDRAHRDDYSWHGVYYEQGFAIAKSLAAILVIALATIADPFSAAFVLAAILSLFFLAH